jgi:hypothetical protein
MANRYWVGGTGTWSTSTTNWSTTSGGASGASAPTSADSVFFDQAGTYTVTLTGALTCFDITVSAGTVTFASTGTITAYGSMSLVAGTIWNATGLLTFRASASGADGAAARTVTTNGVTLSCSVTYFSNDNTPTFTLGSDLTLIDTGTFTFNRGVLILSGFTLTTGLFSSSSTSTRSISFGSGNIVLTQPAPAGLVVDIQNATGFTWTGTGGFVADASVTRIFRFGTTAGGTAANAPNLTFTGTGALEQTLTAGSWWNKLDYGTTTFTSITTELFLNSLTLSSGGTYTNLTVDMRGTGTITGNSKTVAALTVNHSGTTTLASALSTGVTATTTLTSGALDLAGFTLTTGIFSSNNSATRSIAFGSGNIVLTHTTGGTTVLAMATATGFTVSGTGGFVADASVARTYTFGTTGGSITNAPNLTFTSGSSVQTLGTGSWFNKLDFGTTAFNPGTTALNLNGLSLSASGTYTTLSPTIRGTGTVTGNGNATLASLVINTTSGTTTLGSALTLTATSTTTLTSGALDLAGFTLSTGIFSSTNSTTRSIAFGSGNITLTHTTAAQTVLSMAIATSFTYTGTGGFTATAAVTRTFTFGTTGGSATNGPNVTLTGSGTAVQTFTTGSWWNKLDFGNTAFTFASSTQNLNSLTLSSGGTFSSMPVTFRGTGTFDNTFGKSIGTLTINHAGTTTIAGNNLSCTTYTQTAGTVDFANFNVDCRSSDVEYTAGTLTNIGTITCVSWRVTGTFTMTHGTITPSTSFVLTSGAFNYNGGTLSGVPTFTHSTGTVTLGQSLALAATGTYSFSAGTLNLNGFNLTTGIFNASGSATRSVAFGSNNIILSHPSTASVLAMAIATDFTCTGTGGFVSNASVTRTFTFGTTGGSATNAPNLAITSGASVVTFTNGSYFRVLDFTGSTTAPVMSAETLGVYVDTLTLATGGTYTGLVPVFTRTQTWTSQFSKQLGGIGVGAVGVTLTLDNTQTYTATSTCNLFSGTLDLGGYDQTFGQIRSSNSNTRSIAFGSNNIVLAHTTAGTIVLTMTTATGFTYTGTGGFTATAAVTRTFTFGTTGGTAVNAPNLTLTGSGTAVQTFNTGSWFNTVNFGTTAFTVPTTTLNVDSLTLSSTGTYTGLTATMIGTGTITSNSKQLAALTFNHSGTTTLNDAAATIATGTTTLTTGTLNLNGFNLTTGTFSSTGTGVRSVAFGSSNIVLAHTTAGSVVISAADATNFTWTGTGGFTADASITRTYTFGSSYTGTAGGSATNAPNLSITSGASVPTFTDYSWFNSLNFTGSTCAPAGVVYVSTLTLASGGTYTGFVPAFTRTQTWTAQFSKQLGGIGCNITGGTLTLDNTQTYTATSFCVLYGGTLDLGGYDFTIGVFNSNMPNTVARSIAFGSNNIILNTTTASATVLQCQAVLGFTWTGTGGFRADASIARLYSFGISGGGTTTNAPNLTFTGSGTAVQTVNSTGWFNKLDFGTTAFNTGTTNLNLNSLTLSATGTYTSMTATMVGTGTVITNGNTTLGAMVINSTSGTTSLGAAATLAATATTTLTSGALDLAGFTLTTGIFSSSGSSTRSISFGSSNIVLAHTTASQTVLSMATATGFSWTGTGGFTASAAVIRTFTFGTTGGTSTNAPNVTLTTGSAVPIFTTGGWFNILDFGTTSFNIATTTLNLNSLVCSSTGTYGNMTVTMVGTGTITPNGKTVAAFTINHTGTTTLAGAFGTAVTGTTTLTSGALDLAGFTLSTGIFSSTNSTTRSIAFGSGSIALTHTTAATTVLSMATATGFTWTGTGGFTTDASVTRTFTFGSTAGGTATNAPNLSITSGAAVPTFTNGSWFDVLNFTGTTSTPAMSASTIGIYVDTLTLATGGTYTGFIPVFTRTQTWTPQFSKQLGGIGVGAEGVTLTLEGTQTYPVTSTFFLTAGTLDLGGVDQTFGIFSSSNSNTRSVAFGSNNISLVHTTASTTVLAMSTATGFTWTGTGGFVATSNLAKIFQFGNTAGGSITNAPNLTITSGSNVATLTTGSWFNTLDFGTSTFTPGSPFINLNNLILSSTGTYTTFRPTMRGTGTINNNGNTTLEDIFIDNVSGTTSLAAAFSMTNTGATFTLTSGTLSLNGFNLTCPVFSSTNTNTRSVAFGSNNIILVAATAGSDTIDMATATNFTWTGTGGFVTEPNVGRTRDFNFGSVAGGSSTNAPNLTISGAGNFFSSSDFTTNSWFNILDLGICSGGQGTTTIINLNSLILSPNATYYNLFVVMVGTGVITPNGISIKELTVNCPGGTTTLTGSLVTGFGSPSIATLSAGTLNLNGFDLTAGTFSSSTSNTRSIAFGSGNIILTNTAAGETVLNMADATDFTFTGTGGFTTAMSVTRTFSFGSTTGGTATNAPNLSLTSGASVPTFTTGSWFKSLNFTGSTSTPATTRINVDTLTLATGGTYTALTPVFTRTQTWTPQFSKQLDGIGVGVEGVTLTLEGTQTYTETADLYVNAGTLNLNSTDQTFDYFISTGTGSRSITGGGSITVKNDWTVTSGSGFTGSNYAIKMNKSTAKTFAGAGGTYGTLIQNGAGDLTVTGSNSFADIQVI